MTDIRNCKNWVTLVKLLPYELGLKEAWDKDDISYLSQYVIKQRLIDKYIQNTFAMLSNISRLSIYYQYK